MNLQHHAFVDAYLESKNKEAAYAAAYPNAKKSSLQAASSRLLNKPEVKKYIEKRIADNEAVVNAKLQERRLKELLDLEEAKTVLSSIIRGQQVTWRNARVKDGFEKVEVYPTHAQMLRALDMFLKLSDLYPKAVAKKGSGSAEEKEEPEEEFDNYWITIGDKPFDPVEGTKYEQWYPLYYAGILWNPTKPNERAGWAKYMNTLSEEERRPFLENVRNWDKEQAENITIHNNTNPPLKGVADRPGDVDSRATSNVGSTSPAYAQGSLTPPSEGGFQESRQNITNHNNSGAGDTPPPGYHLIKEALKETREIMIRQDTMRNRMIHYNFEKLVNKDPKMNAWQRMLAQQMAGWEQHPTNPQWAKRIPKKSLAQLRYF